MLMEDESRVSEDQSGKDGPETQDLRHELTSSILRRGPPSINQAPIGWKDPLAITHEE